MFAVAPVHQLCWAGVCGVVSAAVDGAAPLLLEHTCAARAAASATKHRPMNTVNVLSSLFLTHNQRDFLKRKYYSELQNVKKFTFFK